MAASQYYFSNSRIVLELIRRSDDSETTAVNDFCCVLTGPDVLLKSSKNSKKYTEVEALSHHVQAALRVRPADPALTPRDSIFEFWSCQKMNFASHSYRRKTAVRAVEAEILSCDGSC